MEDEIDALFKLPLGEFTPARNALAARLKKAGEQAQADAVKALPKPSVPAWVVNQLYWRYREAFDRLLVAGDRFRKSPGTREFLEARRNAQAALVPIATSVLQDAGSSGTREMLRRITTTLEALAAYGSLPDAPRAGRFTVELEPLGFDLLAGLLPPSGGGRRGVEKHERVPNPASLKDAREEERKRVAAAAKTAVRDGERALRTARSQAERTAATLDTAAKRAREAERRRTKAEKQLAGAAAEADVARQREREAEVNARKTALEAESAERLLDLARRKLEEL